MLGPYAYSPDSLPENLTAKLRKPEGAEALLKRSMWAARREGSRMEKGSGVVTHAIITAV